MIAALGRTPALDERSDILAYSFHAAPPMPQSIPLPRWKSNLANLKWLGQFLFETIQDTQSLGTEWI